MSSEITVNGKDRTIPETISGCSTDALRSMGSAFSPESMPEDMRKAIQVSVQSDREERLAELIRFGYRISKRGDVAVASAMVGLLTNHWEIAVAGYSYWMYFSSWTERLENEFKNDGS